MKYATCCRTHGALGLPSRPFSHSDSGICELSSSTSGNGLPFSAITTSVGLLSFQHWSAWVVPRAISSGGGSPPRVSLHFPSVQRRIVPRMRRVAFVLLIGICVLDTLRCRRRRTGAQPRLSGDLFDAHCLEAAGTERIF